MKPRRADHRGSGYSGAFVTMAIAVGLAASAAATADAPADRMLDIKADFGAVGDGAADDTEALQKAFASQDRAVHIPAGIFRFTETLKARKGAKIYGQGGHWKGGKYSTVLLYDGPAEGTAIEAKDVEFFQMRQVTVSGNKKAAVGILWEHARMECLLEDVAIRETTKDGLVISRSYWSYFNRLAVMGNLGNGVTVDQRASSVNYVNFTDCRFSHNGEHWKYRSSFTDFPDRFYGPDNLAAGYGFGFFGAGVVCNLVNCCFEQNGGPGLYIGGWARNFRVAGAYFEHNALHVSRPVWTNGELLWDKNRKDRVRFPSIILDIDGGSLPGGRLKQYGIVFDNVYIHRWDGIWLRGAGRGAPIQFRNVYEPVVVWAEHGNWRWIDSDPSTQLSRLPGIHWRPKGEYYRWWPAEGIASGHPGIRIESCVRTVFPSSEAGITLYVDTDNGNDAHDGRTPEQAWRTLEKAARLFRNCTVDTPFIVVVKGSNVEATQFANIEGIGALTIELEDPAAADAITARNVDCDFRVE